MYEYSMVQGNVETEKYKVYLIIGDVEQNMLQ